MVSTAGFGLRVMFCPTLQMVSGTLTSSIIKVNVCAADVDHKIKLSSASSPQTVIPLAQILDKCY